MKIMIYATPESKGHHYIYFSTLVDFLKSKCADIDIVAVLPEVCEEISCRQLYIPNINWGTKSFLEYSKLINAFIKIVKQEKPDCIHIQCGDNFYRFFGIGFRKLKNYNPIITFHHMRRSGLRDLSLRNIFKNIYCGVVHTAALKQMLNNMGINNVEHIEYPQFQKKGTIDSITARESLGLKQNIPVFLALGATRDDKGLDVLLAALKTVEEDFQLLIAGQESSFTKEYIANNTSSYSDKVVTLLKFLDDKEFDMCMNAADFVVLPYKKCFDGASGPLGEGVVQGKTIIGPNHGSLGDIIIKNHLGYTFESENEKNLSDVLSQALNDEFVHDSFYKAYQENLNPEYFLEKYKNLFEHAMKGKK